MKFILKLWNNEKIRPYLVGVIGLILGIVSTIFMYPTKQIKEETEKALRSQIEQEAAAFYQRREAEMSENNKKIVNELTSQLEKSLAESNSLQKKVSSLSTEVKTLKQKRKTQTKIVKDPSGKETTVIVDESESESSSNKQEKQVSELTKKHEKEIKELKSTHESKMVEENSKREKQVSELNSQLSSAKTKIEELEKSKKEITTNTRNFGVGVGYTTDRLYSAEISYQFWGPVYIQVSGDSDIEDKYRARGSLGIRF